MKSIEELMKELKVLEKEFLNHNYKLTFKISNNIALPRKKPLSEELLYTVSEEEDAAIIKECDAMYESDNW